MVKLLIPVAALALAGCQDEPSQKTTCTNLITKIEVKGLMYYSGRNPVFFEYTDQNGFSQRFYSGDSVVWRCQKDQS